MRLWLHAVVCHDCHDCHDSQAERACSPVAVLTLDVNASRRQRAVHGRRERPLVIRTIIAGNLGCILLRVLAMIVRTGLGENM